MALASLHLTCYFWTMMKLGQHFLKNAGAVKKIIDALELKEGDVLVEVGPGHGELTKELIKKYIRLIAVEKDEKLANELQKNIRTREHKNRLKIIKGDILEELPKLAGSPLTSSGYKLVGNIPYYLTGFLLRTVGELKNKPNLVVFMIQKEVAERLAAKPPRMNLLAASIQYWANPKVLFTLPPKDFNPPPKVNSAVIRLKNIKTREHENTRTLKHKNKNGEEYYKFIKILFKQPRKTILNNLVDGLKINREDVYKRLVELGLNEKSRPGELTIEAIKNLIIF